MFARFIFISGLLASSFTAYASDDQAGGDLASVTNFMLKNDYPELFKDTAYHVKIESMLTSDVLNDGSHDVVVLVTPNYRQSATILIYELAKDGTVNRVTEGLAPGPLVPITDKYLDSHTLGEAVDVSAGEKQHDPAARQVFITAGLKNFGGFVEYKDFFHADGRHGPAWFVNMSDVESPLEGNDCSKFEFSTVDSIASRRIDGAGNKNYLIAKVSKQFYIYLIDGLKDETFLNKKLWVVPVPADFSDFSPGNLSPLKYMTADGHSKNLSVPEISKE